MSSAQPSASSISEQPRTPRAFPRWLLFWLPAAYIVVSAALLAWTLVTLRDQALASGERLTRAFARIIEANTTHTIDSVTHTLERARAELNHLESHGTVNEQTMREVFRGLLSAQPYLRAIWLLGPDGRIVFDSDEGNIGADFSDRSYFQQARDRPDGGFALSPAVQSRTMGAWFVPTTLPWRRPDGTFAGVLVAALDTAYLDKVWTLDDPGEHSIVALFRRNGQLLMHSPFVESAMGQSMPQAWLFQRIAAGETAGTGEATAVLDGRMRIFSYSVLTEYPDLVISVGRSREHILAEWRTFVAISVVAWALAAILVGAVFLWLMREWRQRAESEAALAASRDRLQAIAQNVADGIITSDQNSRILSFSRGAERIFGYTENEIVGQHIRVLFSEPMRSASDQEIAAYVEAEVERSKHSIIEVQRRRKDGTVFPAERGIAEIPGTVGGRQFVTTIRDISARKATEEQLRQAQKMEAVGQLTGGVAHDFNNMLTVIMGNTEYALDELPTDSPLRPVLDDVLKAAEGSAELTARLLAFARRQTLQPKRVQVNEFIARIEGLLKRTLSEDIDIKLDLASDTWDVMIDASQLEAALVNLAVNARDAMPTGGILTIEAANVRLDEDYAAQNPDARPGDFVAVTVSDNGSGMAPETAQRAFEPFFTTKEVGKGTGLGLSMVYGFVRQSGGHVKIYSEVGQGTSVKMYLPRDVEAVSEQIPVQPERTALPTGAESILVVEDDSRVRDNVAAHLARLGYRVRTAESGPAAVAILESGATFDLLFTDIVMPGGMNGRDVADRARRILPTIKVLYTSGYTRDAVVHGGRLDPGVALLSKPYRLHDLAAKLRAVLDAS